MQAPPSPGPTGINWPFAVTFGLLIFLTLAVWALAIREIIDIATERPAACAAALLDDEYAALNRHLHGDGDTRAVRMTIDTAKLRDETLALIAQEDCDWCVDGLQADGETPCSCRLGATSPAADTLRLLDEIDRLRAENERLGRMAEKAGGAGDQMTDYRIVKAMVEYCNGHTSHYAIGYMAERRLRLFGLHILWWPCINARWRRTAYDAQLDVRNDAELRKELATK